MENSKSLNTIMTLTKIAKVLSMIVFICTIIGAVGVIIGLIGFGSISDYVIDGKTVAEHFTAETGLSAKAIYPACAIGLLACIAEAVIAYLAYRYFVKVLEVGTPFTFKGADEMRKLGIIQIIVYFAIAIVSAIVMQLAVGTSGSFNLELDGSLGTGLAFLIVSVIFRHGAELRSTSTIID